MQLRPGLRLKSTTCDGEFIIVRAPKDDVDIRCGGQPLSSDAADKTDPKDGFATGSQMGKRYGGDDLGLEVLCTKPGKGTLTIGDEPLPLKEAKLLPSSD